MRTSIRNTVLISICDIVVVPTAVFIDVTYVNKHFTASQSINNLDLTRFPVLDHVLKDLSINLREKLVF